MPAQQRRIGATLAALTMTMLWIGLLIGVSFLATPAKFLASGLSLAVALDVGRHTFAIFSKLECLLCLALVALLFSRLRTPLSVAMGVVLVLVVLLETTWLLPLLDQRVGLILAGQPPAATLHHQLYVSLEVAKLIALIVVGAAMARRLLLTSGEPQGSSSAEISALMSDSIAVDNRNPSRAAARQSRTAAA